MSFRSSALLAVLATVFTVLVAARVGWAGKVEDLCKALLADPSFKVRVQAALLLGKLGDKGGTDALIKALDDEDKSVRAMAAQSLGKLGGAAAAPALKALLGREHDSFVTTQIKIALSALEDQEVKDRKIFVTIGPFSGGVKLADASILALLQTSLKQSLQKLPKLTFNPETPAKGRGRTPSSAFSSMAMCHAWKRFSVLGKLVARSNSWLRAGRPRASFFGPALGPPCRRAGGTTTS